MNTFRIKLSRGIKRVTILQPTASGDRMSAVVYEGRRKKKRKQSRAYRPMEALSRRLARGMSTFGDEYSARHKRSNQKKRNGWLKDYSKNTNRAQRRAMKKIRLSRIFR